METIAQSFTSSPENTTLKSINYTSHSIRLVDVGFQSNDICSSFPPSSLTPRDFCTSISYCERAVSPVTFLSCENPIQSPIYINRTGYCNTRDDSGDGYYSYVVAGKVTIWDVADSCSVEMLHISSSPLIRERGSNLPLLDFHRELGHGFEVSWYWYIGDYKRCRERASCFGDSVIVTDVCGDDSLLFLVRDEHRYHKPSSPSFLGE
ncbi:hypothetical protein RHMOL_Rhmol03G0226200 [Rhododendron molle]|uniref:Uncharacterized protein n=1 Tax=Rhododendron molle TaxID=49168 RepID=A0ACC0PKF5_RHOML|nr:hypothetical protein RHMOL_Rhmol03G0226200 [Rhododendron molle]